MFYEGRRKFDGQSVLINLDNVSIIMRPSSDDFKSYVEVEFIGIDDRGRGDYIELMGDEYEKISNYLAKADLLK